MHEQIRARLAELKKELEAGQTELQKVQTQRTYLHETVLRISGAVQVLEELLREGQADWAERGSRSPSGEGEGSTTDTKLRKE